MKVLDEIRTWRGKPKELVAFLVESIEKDEKLFSQLIEVLKSGSDVEKGTVADVMKHVSKDKPEIAAPYIDDMIEYVNYRAPRVKWGVPESIGNMAQKYPTEVEKAILNLLKNTKDESTVVRWCAAYASSEIAKSIPSEKDMLLKIQELADNEQNNGVKNVYLKALKTIAFRNKLK